MSDILDRIDALVDEQLAGGEPETGYSFGDPTYPRCPHCDRHWHGLPITNKIANMYTYGQFDPEYTYATDDSGIICEGSDFIGPRRPTNYESRAALWGIARGGVTVTIRDDTFSAVMERMQRRIQDMYSALMGITDVTFPTFEFHHPRRGLGVSLQAPWVIYDEAWNLVEPGPPPCPGPLPEVDIKFGPENWHLDFQYPRSHQCFPSRFQRQDPASRAVRYHWQALTAPNHPIPASPGYDFSGYDTDPPTSGPPQRNLDGRRTR